MRTNTHTHPHPHTYPLLSHTRPVAPLHSPDTHDYTTHLNTHTGTPRQVQQTPPLQRMQVYSKPRQLTVGTVESLYLAYRLERSSGRRPSK